MSVQRNKAYRSFDQPKQNPISNRKESLAGLKIENKKSERLNIK